MADLPPVKPSYRRVVAALAESEERYRVLVEGVRRYAIFMLNPDGIIITWNRGIHELLGYERDDVIGQSGAMVFGAADRAAGVFKKELATAKRKGESALEHSNRRKDGTEIRVHDTATALRNSDGVLLGFAKVTRRLETPADPAAEATALELAKALATIQAEVEHRHRLEAQLLTAVEEERERLGRDLHDDVSQQLAGLAIMMGSLARRVQRRDAATAERMRELATSLSHAVAAARNLSRGLHPVTLTSHGLPAALAELSERVPKEVEFSWPQSERLDLESSVALHVYRIAEEAIGNAIRHSQAQKIRIVLQMKPQRRVALIISDDGKGFEQGVGPEGMGLQNMRYRAGAIGGTLKITAAPGQGTCVKCTLPLRHLGSGRAASSRRSSRGGVKPRRKRR
jgi:PAS domain S-box-containing protein